jgi:hypothetical protein
MKRRSLGLLAIAAVGCLLVAARILACPMCNIHNYLGLSVRSSSQVLVVKAVEGEKDQFQVARVLRGSDRLLGMKLYGARERFTQGYILCNPSSEPPTFEILPLDMEEEVAWLIATDRQSSLIPERTIRAGIVVSPPGYPYGAVDLVSALSSVVKDTDSDRINADRFEKIGQAQKASVANVEECLHRLQGISNESRAAGMEWLRAQKAFPTASLLGALQSVRSAPINKEEFDRSYRLACLVEALTLFSPGSEIQTALQKELDWCLKNLGGRIDWTEMRQVAGWQARYLSALINATAMNAWHPARWAASFTEGRQSDFRSLGEKLIQRVMETAPALEELGLAQTVYALADWNAMPPGKLAALAATEQNKDAVALGLYWANIDRIGIYSGNEGLAAVQLAASLAREPRLKKEIDRSLQFARNMK